MPEKDPCAKCGTPMVCGHNVALDTRAYWRICCLCSGELIQMMNGQEVTRGAADQGQ